MRLVPQSRATSRAIHFSPTTSYRLYDLPFGPEGNLRCAANFRAEQIVAVQTRAESTDRATASRIAILLADAFADGALKGALVEFVTAQRGALATSRQRLEAKIAGDRASLARVEKEDR